MARKKRLRITVVTFRDGGVLLVKEKGRRKYCLPGGDSREGELYIDTAADILSEELNLVAYNVHAIPLISFKDSRYRHKVFIATDVRRKLRLKGQAFESFVWWDGESPLPVYYATIDLLRELQPFIYHQLGYLR